MASNHLLPQLLSGTRRRIVVLLRTQDRTVRELADALDLTRNAIRSQLSKLESDDLAEVVDRRPTERKPENVYGLTDKAEQLFPKAYDEILGTLLSVLSETSADLSGLLREVAARLARPHTPHRLEDTVRDRLERAKQVLEDMGGLPVIEESDDAYRLEGMSCPLAALVDEHGEIACDMACALIEELTDLPIEQRCQTTGACPQCAFVVERS